MKNIVYKIKSKLWRLMLLLRKRQMFYIEPAHNSNWYFVKYPDEKYKNMTHAEWFSNINVDLKTTIRGYYNDGVVLIYTGINHESIKLDTQLESKILDICNSLKDKGYIINKIGIGGINSKWRTLLGITWKANYYINMDLYPAIIRKI